MKKEERYDQLIKIMKELQLDCNEQDEVHTIEDSQIVMEIIIQEMNKWVLEDDI